MIAITHRVEFNNDLEQLVKSKIDQALQSNEEYKEQAITLMVNKSLKVKCLNTLYWFTIHNY
jgi:hypothetical protein